MEGKVLRKGASNKFGVKENLKKYKGGGGGFVGPVVGDQTDLKANKS